jgi:hypothetical protein
MAIFTRRSELAQQKKHKNYSKATGSMRTSAMALAGYKDTGEKNLWGKINPIGTPGNLIAGKLASGTDAGEVINSQRSDEIAGDLATAKLAVSIAGVANPGGATGGGGMFGKAGTKGMGAGGGATKAGAFISQAGGGTSETIANGGSVFQGEAGKALTDKMTSENKQALSDSMNASMDLTDEDAAAPSPGEMEAIEEGEVESTETDATADTLSKVGDATSMIPVAGEAIALAGQKMAIANNYKNKRKEIAGRTYSSNEATRV